MAGFSTVLIADDDQNDVFFLRRAFQKSGLSHRLFEVQDGQQAVDYLSGLPPFQDRSQYPLPSLLLLDLKMPKMTGFEVLSWLKTQPALQQIPVVVLSGSNQVRDVEQARSLGAAEYHVKPADFDDLLKFVRDLDVKWLATPSPQQRPA
jgi:CheY-like chemotaxis protein